MSKKLPVDRIVALAKQGLQTKVIAERLGGSINTISTVLRQEGFVYNRSCSLTSHWEKRIS